MGNPNSQKCKYLYIVAHIWKTGGYFCPLLYICLVLLPWNFHSPGFDITPQDPPQIWKKTYIFLYFGYKFKKNLYCFLIWHVHRYRWEDSWKARWTQSDQWTPPQGPPNSPKYTYFGSYMKNWFSNCFPLYIICLHCDEVCICWHFGAPATPGFYVRAQHAPEKLCYYVPPGWPAGHYVSRLSVCLSFLPSVTL